MSKNKEEKYTLTIRMDSKTEQEIREKMDDAHVRSLNAFVLKAIDFYLGYSQARQKSKLYFTDTRLKHQK